MVVLLPCVWYFTDNTSSLTTFPFRCFSNSSAVSVDSLYLIRLLADPTGTIIVLGACNTEVQLHLVPRQYPEIPCLVTFVSGVLCFGSLV